MDSPAGPAPVPKPRTAFAQTEPLKRPEPLPRTKVPQTNDRVTASDILRSISTVSKQITEDVAAKVSHSAKSANEKFEKSIIDGSRFAMGTLEKTITSSRAMRDTVTRSVIESTRTAGLKLRRAKKVNCSDEEGQRCTSMPVVDVSLFDNIQFHSPLLEQKRYPADGDSSNNANMPSQNLNSSHCDDLSLFSSNSDSNTDTVSNFSHDSRDFDHNLSGLPLDDENITYDTPRGSRANSIISLRSVPEVPERRKKRASLMRENSIYENWTLPNSVKNKLQENGNVPRPSKSAIYEFDPLSSNSDTPKKYEGISNELLLLESFLIDNTYGRIVANDNTEDTFEDFGESDYFNPPTPPERTDSLCPIEEQAETTKQNKSLVNKDRNSNWFITETDTKSVDEESKPSHSVMQRFSHILKLDRPTSKAKTSLQKVEQVAKPPVNKLPAAYFSGALTRIISGVVEDLFKNSQTRYCVLSDQKLMCYADPTNSQLKEAYMLDYVYSLQIVLPLSSSTTGNSYCFIVSVSANGPHGSTRKILFSCTSASERRNWAQKFAEHLTGSFPTKYTSEFTRCGWCFLKEGVSGEWRGAWVMLVRRALVYSAGNDNCTVVDLRKTRCVVTQEPDEEAKAVCGADCGDNLLLDCPHATLYLRFPNERELKGWRYMIKMAAHNNGTHIHHQQLTRHEVPAIVDKCISFIYTHGSLTEGIYRRAGTTAVLTELLSRFRRDAWSVQLSPGQHSEHDVAGVLKRFFRDLPEPLLPQEKHDTFVAALAIKDDKTRHAEFRNIMMSLPVVSRNTARKLFAHLHFLQTLAHANKMSAENLASVWAPTIMPAALTSNTLQTAWSSTEVYVVRELIANFEAIWEPTEAESRREAAMRGILMRVLSNSVPAAPKAAGDLRAWIYVKDRSNCYQVALTPNKTSSDLCIELCEKANMESHLLMVEEVICNESMRRIVHIDEILLDVVLRWGYWDEEDRKDNYLLVKENKILHDLEANKQTTSVCGELRMANEGSKAFKLHMFEFKNSKLSYFKDKMGSQKIEEWDIKDILWYVGHEPKRNPQARWAITFIPRKNKPNRSKDKHWFGCTIAGAVTDDQLRWMAAMTYAEHNVILPTPRLVIT